MTALPLFPAQIILRFQGAARLLPALGVTTVHQAIALVPNGRPLATHNRLSVGHQELWLDGYDADALVMKELLDRPDHRLVRLIRIIEEGKLRYQPISTRTSTLDIDKITVNSALDFVIGFRRNKCKALREMSSNSCGMILIS